ncbi:hypothetical protein HCN44_009732 [Aphidius gifuensis]|uniref:Zinc finger protein 593 homolog n=1 Tax=Aphidius gifuensis TaxID=684658 RepID=A0A834Y6V9_APHGI|nr:zinc finger protein 593 [Aphidius gifuensis]KAF7998334.1 hypothetical protein HCN44_009732 [Aphidius gifuensis]
MGNGKYARKKTVQSHGMKKGCKSKRKTKDLDEIDVDLEQKNVTKLINQPIDLDKPGAAQFYCLHCARYFINDRALTDHFRTKVHKRRLKALEQQPYSIAESERAASHGNWVVAGKRKIQTITPVSFKGRNIYQEFKDATAMQVEA